MPLISRFAPTVLEILGLIQQRELARADEHILELEAEELASSGGGAPVPPKAEGAGSPSGGGRRARGSLPGGWGRRGGPGAWGAQGAPWGCSELGPDPLCVH